MRGNPDQELQRPVDPDLRRGLAALNKGSSLSMHVLQGSCGAFDRFLPHCFRTRSNHERRKRVDLTGSASPPRMTGICCANRTNPLIRWREHQGRAAFDELGNKKRTSGAWTIETASPSILSLWSVSPAAVFAERLISAGAAGCKIRSRDYFARPSGAVLLRLPLAR